MQVKAFVAILFIGLLSACTPYQQNSFLGGYDELMLDENVYRVTFRGNKYTSMERATDFTLLRCAELTLENGMNYFVLLDSQAREKSSLNYNPGSLNVAPSYSVASKPRTSNTIVILKDKPSDVFAYNASQIAKSVKTKYDIK